jgi:hypothetical protein
LIVAHDFVRKLIFSSRSDLLVSAGKAAMLGDSWTGAALAAMLCTFDWGMVKVLSRRICNVFPLSLASPADHVAIFNESLRPQLGYESRRQGKPEAGMTNVRTQAHSRGQDDGLSDQVTLTAALLACLLALPVSPAFSQSAVATPSPAEICSWLRQKAQIDAASIPDGALDRAAIISLDDGTIAFTSDVDGRITGAFFIGEEKSR